jgi:hypothetical protein
MPKQKEIARQQRQVARDAAKDAAYRALEGLLWNPPPELPDAAKLTFVDQVMIYLRAIRASRLGTVVRNDNSKPAGSFFRRWAR